MFPGLEAIGFFVTIAGCLGLQHLGRGADRLTRQAREKHDSSPRATACPSPLVRDNRASSAVP